MDEFGLIKKLGKLSAPFMRFMGLSSNAGYVWIVAIVIGFVYGSAVLLEEARSGNLTSAEMNLLNCHAAINHAQIEDAFIFMALGVPLLLAALPRFIAAVLAVWLEKGISFAMQKIYSR